MWCSNCQHGHVPVMRYIEDRKMEMSVCPCCGAELHEGVISSKEEQLKEIAKRMGITNLAFTDEKKGFTVGIKEDAPVPKMTEAITTENIMAKLAPEVELEVVKKPVKKSMSKK